MLGAVMSTTCNAIATTSNKTLLARYATPKTQGSVMGTVESINAVAGVLGPLVSGAIFDEGWQDWLPAITACFYLLSALSVLAVYFHTKRTGHQVAPNEMKLVDFSTVMGELIFLRSRVHELEVENQRLRGSARRNSGEKKAGINRDAFNAMHSIESHRHVGVL